MWTLLIVIGIMALWFLLAVVGLSCCVAASKGSAALRRIRGHD